MISEFVHEYQPTCLRLVMRPRKLVYGVGIPDSAHPGSFGMLFGPAADERDCLEYAPMLHPDAVIVCFKKDHTDEVLWRWDKDLWRRVSKPKPLAALDSVNPAEEIEIIEWPDGTTVLAEEFKPEEYADMSDDYKRHRVSVERARSLGVID